MFWIQEAVVPSLAFTLLLMKNKHTFTKIDVSITKCVFLLVAGGVFDTLLSCMFSFYCYPLTYFSAMMFLCLLCCLLKLINILWIKVENENLDISTRRWFIFLGISNSSSFYYSHKEMLWIFVFFPRYFFFDFNRKWNWIVKF